MTITVEQANKIADKIEEYNNTVERISFINLNIKQEENRLVNLLRLRSSLEKELEGLGVKV